MNESEKKETEVCKEEGLIAKIRTAVRSEVDGALRHVSLFNVVMNFIEVMLLLMLYLKD